MAKVERLTELVKALQDKAARSRKDDDCSVSVGYTANYAVYVHENLQAHHTVGEAKFLEGPARRMSRQLGEIVLARKRQGMTTAQALVIAGLTLQRASQQLCPVDTGNMRAGAFTRLDDKGT
jgi:hypothetical protein